MKKKFLLIYVIICSALLGQNSASVEPLSMCQLMTLLQVDGGNYTFKFDRPVFAVVDVNIKGGGVHQEDVQERFKTDVAVEDLDLYFVVSNWQVGEYSRGDIANNSKRIQVCLSNCKATKGTRQIYYWQKYSSSDWIRGGNDSRVSSFRPSIAVTPELNKEYVLHYYTAEGDGYEVLATIVFVEQLSRLPDVEKFGTEKFRRWAEVTDQ